MPEGDHPSCEYRIVVFCYALIGVRMPAVYLCSGTFVDALFCTAGPSFFRLFLSPLAFMLWLLRSLPWEIRCFAGGNQ